METQTCLLILHLAGMMIGLGSVTTLDLYLVRFLRSAVVTSHDVELMELVSRMAALGLLLLWASGLGFLYLYWIDNPAALANPKLHAKLAIVGILTLNGAVLHAWVLPKVERAVGRPLFAPPAPAGDRFRLGVFGAISVASWWTPFVLGAVRELNFTLSVGSFLIAYAVVLAAVAGAMAALAVALDR